MNIAERLRQGPLAPEEAVDVILTVAAELSEGQRKQRITAEEFLRDKE